MDAVRCYIQNSQNQWDLHLQQIAGAIRASVNQSTGFTANKLMLGREVNTPAYLMFPQHMSKSTNADDYVTKLTDDIQRAHVQARETLKTSFRRMKRNYDLRILERPYKEGDVVYLLDTAVIKGKCRKLSQPWKGPAVITSKISGSLYRVKLKNAVFVVNHDRLKPCRDRNLPLWIRKWQDDPSAGSDSLDQVDQGVYCYCRQPGRVGL